MTPSYLLILLLTAIFAVLLLGLARTIVFEYERGLRFRRGRFNRVLDPGAYWYFRAFTHIQKVDIRPARVAVAGQEVLSADGVAVKASLAATYRISDARRAVLATDDFRTAVYTELQLALRAIVSETRVEDLLQQRAELSARLKTIPAANLAVIGIELEDAAVRDLTLPGELKKIFSQVVKARQEGLAALERARGETAALRNLANAAQMIERSPSLIQLRLLQVLSQQPGNTVVLGVQQQSTPIPIRDHVDAELPPQGNVSEAE
ncbi:MAG TPA: SPFH domain-containing protein [Vicinamibacterales bacterium]|nr:SPFH domain-containing protein [Vicinamibacterales bacterium]